MRGLSRIRIAVHRNDFLCRTIHRKLNPSISQWLAPTAALRNGRRPSNSCANHRGNATLRSRRSVQRTPDGPTALVQHMRVNHRRLHTGMAEQFLYGSYVVAALQQMRGKRMPETVSGGPCTDLGPASRLRDFARNRSFVQMMPTTPSGSRVDRNRIRGKQPLPAPIGARRRSESRWKAPDNRPGPSRCRSA